MRAVAPEKRSIFGRWWFWVIAAVVGLFVIGGIASAVGGGGSSTGANPTGGAATTEAGTTPPASTQPTAAASPKPAPAAPVAAISDDGTFLVPADVKPGTYTAPKAAFGCYWEREKGTTGEFGDILANENAIGPTVVTILKTDKAFLTRGCGDWLAGTPKIVSNTREINDGTWVVGVNIAPGTYKVTASDGCYWARLKSFSGGMDSIIANDNVKGRAVVTIKKTDKGFTSSNCGTWKP
jgi:hypothetical protein